MVLYDEGPANNDPDIIRELLAANPGSAEEEDANVGCSTTRIFFFLVSHLASKSLQPIGGYQKDPPDQSKGGLRTLLQRVTDARSHDSLSA